MSYTRYKAGPWYDGSERRRIPWKGEVEVDDTGLRWRSTQYLQWDVFAGAPLSKLLTDGYWQLAIPEELRVSEGL